MNSNDESNSSQYETGEHYTSCLSISGDSEDEFNEFNFQKRPYSSSNQSSSSSIHSCDNHSSGNTIEMLEENNNDTNNNIDNENNEDFVMAIEGPSLSSQPGCSKHFDVLKTNSNGTDINEVAQQIRDQISTINHKKIVDALKKAQLEGNAKYFNLSNFLQSRQSKLIQFHKNCAYSGKVKVTSNAETLPSELPSVFVSKVYIDLTTKSDNQSVPEPEIVLNKFQCPNLFNLSPALRDKNYNIKLNNYTEIVPSLYDYHAEPLTIPAQRYAKAVPNLPNPKSHNTKVHITEYHDNIENDHNTECILNRKEIPNQSKKNSKLMSSNIDIIHSTIAARRACPVSDDTIDCQIEYIKTKKSEYSPSRTFNRPIWRRKTKSLISLKSLPVIATRKSVPSNIEILQCQKEFYRKIKSKYKSDVSATVTTNSYHNNNNNNNEKHCQSNKKREEFEFNIQAAHKVFLSENTITTQFAHVNNLKGVLPSSIQQISLNELSNVKMPKLMNEIHTGLKLDMQKQVPPIVLPLNNINTKFKNDTQQPGILWQESTVKLSVNSEIYNKLRAIFPNLKRDYIKKFCLTNESRAIFTDVQLSNIVDKVFNEQPLWEIDNNFEKLLNNSRENNAGVKSDVLNIEETFEYLTGIFPDAEPHYLRDVASKFDDKNALETFVNQQLRKHDYPTRQQYFAKLKITQEQERYTKNFIIADFVKIFPDPFKYFENPERKCQFNIICSEFLKSIHNRKRVSTISSIYANCHYNMSLASRELELWTEEMKSRRSSREIPTVDILLLQEMAFIRNYHEIRNYIDQKQCNELRELKKLRSEGKLLICQCCYDDECMPMKCSQCENGHIFCDTCVISGTDSKLGDDETHILCFFGCGKEFSLSTLQKILLPTTFSILLKKRQAAEVMAAGLQGLVSCPFCHFASIPAEGDKVFKCLNPECVKESCMKCREPNHVPLRCDEVGKRDEARKFIEEKMTQALARTCYKCKRSFFKEEGCNKITCPCGAQMCYLCNEPIKDYSHFAGQGSNETKCPLWTDNQRLNAETVRKVAEGARNQLLRQNPTLVIDTEKLTPALPPPTAGPHNHIPGAQNIAEQLAARVMEEDY